jgi:predicted SAM-dependent methyltransferase
MKRYWHPIKEVTEFIEFIAQGKVLELGPGSIPFNKATHFCGHSEEEKSRFQNYSLCDFSSQVFPYENKEFDFVYARHVIEDLNNPVHFLQECKRIAKAGYFETPSPYVEIQKILNTMRLSIKDTIIILVMFGQKIIRLIYYINTQLQNIWILK